MYLRAALTALLLILPTLGSATPTLIGTVKQGAPGCMTEKLLDQFLDAALKDDQATGLLLLHDSCIILKKDMPVVILDLVGEKMKVESNDGGPKLDMWVPAKYVEQ